MNRIELREQIVLALMERNDRLSARDLVRYVDGDVTTAAVRSSLMNLERNGVVDRFDDRGGAKWEIVRDEVEDRLVETFRAEDAPADDR